MVFEKDGVGGCDIPSIMVMLIAVLTVSVGSSEFLVSHRGILHTKSNAVR